MNTDNELMLKLKEKDFDKLGILFERHKGNLFGYFFKITYDRDISEDMVQDVFIKIMKYRNSFRGYGKFSTWMYSIAHNVSVDHFRKESKYMSNKDPEILNSVKDQDHEQKTLRDEGFDMLNKAMLRLVPEKREVLTLSKIDGLKYKEVGEILNCSENTVKGRVFRALKDLKDIYSKMEVPER